MTLLALLQALDSSDAVSSALLSSSLPYPMRRSVSLHLAPLLPPYGVRWTFEPILRFKLCTSYRLTPCYEPDQGSIQSITYRGALKICRALRYGAYTWVTCKGQVRLLSWCYGCLCLFHASKQRPTPSSCQSSFIGTSTPNALASSRLSL